MRKCTQVGSHDAAKVLQNIDSSILGVGREFMTAPRTELEFLFSTEPPWLSVGFDEPGRKHWIPSHFYSREGRSVCVRRLRGNKMRTTSALMNEFASAFQFFDGFGENWHALEECLCYLDEWLSAQAYVLVVDSAECLLTEDSDESLGALLKTLHLCGEWWSRPVVDNPPYDRVAVPFHVLFNVDKYPVGAQRLLAAVPSSTIPIRTPLT